MNHLEPITPNNDPYRNLTLLGGISERWNSIEPPFNRDTEAFALTTADMDFPLSEDIRKAIADELFKADFTICYAIADQSWRVVVADWVR